MELKSKVWIAFGIALFVAPPTIAQSVSCPSYGALPAAPADYAGALSAFAQYRNSKQPEIRAEGNLPFLRTHGHPTAKSILFAHGLTDSPYYVAALGDAFYERGFNVVSILLPGHGTHPECLLNVTNKQWEDEFLFGLGIARRLGETVSMGGFSTGGALSLDAVALNSIKSPGERIPIENLFLFSPAIGIEGAKKFLCDSPAFMAGFEKENPWQSNPNAVQPVCNDQDAKTARETFCYKYVKNAKNSACQLVTLVQANQLESIGKAIAAQGIGVFAVESMADTTVSPEAVVKFMSELAPGVRQEHAYYDKSENIAHADVPRPETNPHYEQMLSAIDGFLKASAPQAPPPAPSALSRLERNIEEAEKKVAIP